MIVGGDLDRFRYRGNRRSARAAKVSTVPTGLYRRGWNVARSALTARIGAPVRNWARSIQWVPMSATARRFVRPSGSTRQL